MTAANMLWLNSMQNQLRLSHSHDTTCPVNSLICAERRFAPPPVLVGHLLLPADVNPHWELLGRSLDVCDEIVFLPNPLG